MEVRLVVKRGKTSAKEIWLRKLPAIVGRHSECTLRVISKLVSRRHCLLQVRDGWVTAKDLNSSNGTLVNGNRITAETVLKPGDTLEIGPISFDLDYTPAGEAPGPLPVAAQEQPVPPSPAAATVEAAAGPSAGVPNALFESDDGEEPLDRDSLKTVHAEPPGAGGKYEIKPEDEDDKLRIPSLDDVVEAALEAGPYEDEEGKVASEEKDRGQPRPKEKRPQGKAVSPADSASERPKSSANDEDKFFEFLKEE